MSMSNRSWKIEKNTNFSKMVTVSIRFLFQNHSKIRFSLARTQKRKEKRKKQIETRSCLTLAKTEAANTQLQVAAPQEEKENELENTLQMIATAEPIIQILRVRLCKWGRYGGSYGVVLSGLRETSHSFQRR